MARRCVRVTSPVAEAFSSTSGSSCDRAGSVFRSRRALCESFERAVLPLLAPLHRQARRMTGNRADAEELLQD